LNDRGANNNFQFSILNEFSIHFDFQYSMNFQFISIFNTQWIFNSFRFSIVEEYLFFFTYRASIYGSEGEEEDEVLFAYRIRFYHNKSSVIKVIIIFYCWQLFYVLKY